MEKNKKTIWKMTAGIGLIIVYLLTESVFISSANRTKQIMDE